MKFFVLPCLIASATLAGPAVAGQPGPDIEVSAPSSIAAWSQTIGSELGNNIDNKIASYSMGTSGTPTGVASVRFRCSDTGEPTAVELIRKSGDSRLNNMAKGVVSDIKTLHPLPSGVGPDQVFVANVVIASSQQDYDQKMDMLRDEARQTRLASAGRNPIAFTVGASAVR